ncbi:carbohydrate ABC transporter permease [Halorubrum sp. CBA1125]|uniref:ABC transporter permease subunit n=1 Tax=Halorubrum sp. CBA1125 TaxID=2668072 RepID=UPI0012E8AA9D|nr:sugar ABC transporter permease [Halorubrum sp. CBA1125]
MGDLVELPPDPAVPARLDLGRRGALRHATDVKRVPLLAVEVGDLRGRLGGHPADRRHRHRADHQPRVQVQQGGSGHRLAPVPHSDGAARIRRAVDVRHELGRAEFHPRQYRCHRRGDPVVRRPQLRDAPADDRHRVEVRDLRDDPRARAAPAIPEGYYDAARVCGASRWQKFRDITLPNLKGVIFIVVLLRGIWMFNKYDIIAVMTNGGPGDATQTAPIYAYKLAFQSYNLGESAAVSVILFGILIVAAVIYFRVLEPESEVRTE